MAAPLALALTVASPPAALAGAAPARSLCFQQLSGPPGALTIEQLRLDLGGERVAGFYRWFPWQKDRRVGRLEGRLVAAGTARVLYRFLQEGQWDSARLTILFDDRQARIRWDGPASSVPSSPPQPMPPVLLPHHPCTQLKPVPGL